MVLIRRASPHSYRADHLAITHQRNTAGENDDPSTVRVYLPQGTWSHYWTGERIEGPAHVLAHAPLGEPAIYARANTAVPMWPAMNRVGERPADPLTLLIHPAEGMGESTLYEDVGNGFGYERGEYARRRVVCEAWAAGSRRDLPNAWALSLSSGNLYTWS